MSPQDALALQAELQTALRRLHARSCRRPVLRGRAVMLRADPLVVDLVEARGAHAACAAYVKPRSAALRQGLLRGGAVPDPAPGPVVKGDLSRLAERCGSAARALSKGVRFGAVCSPYRAGKRRLPSFLTLVHVQHAVAALAVEQAQRDPAEAAWRLLEILRFGQDLERGGTPWIWPYVMRSAWRPVVASLARLFSACSLTAVEGQALDRGLAALLASEPPLALHVRGERLHVEWSTYLMPWARRVARAPSRSHVQAEQGHLLAWMAYRAMALRFERACPPSVPPRQCLPAWQALSRQAVAAARDLKEQWAVFEQLLASGQLRGQQGAFDRQAARQAALAVLAGHHPTRHDRHLLRAAQRGFYLTALRLHLAVRRAQQALAAKPPAKPLDVSAVEALARGYREPFSGAPLVVSGRPGEIVLRPAVSLAAAGEPEARYVMRWSARCPAPR